MQKSPYQMDAREVILCAGELCLPDASLVLGQGELQPSHMIMSRAADVIDRLRKQITETEREKRE